MSTAPSQPSESPDPTGRRLTRRTFVATAALGTVSLYLVGCGTGDSSSTATPSSTQVADFVTVSRILTGVSELPTAPAAAYLTALEAAGLQLSPNAFVATAFGTEGAPESMSDLERMGATKMPGADECMRAIAGAWWSGMVSAKGGATTVVAFSDALVFTKVHEFTQCYGTTGSWGAPGEKAT